MLPPTRFSAVIWRPEREIDEMWRLERREWLFGPRELFVAILSDPVGPLSRVIDLRERLMVSSRQELLPPTRCSDVIWRPERKIDEMWRLSIASG